MTSSYITPAKTTSDLFDGIWPGPLGQVYIEVKRSSNARDVRDGLIGLAYQLVRAPANSQAICLLGKSRLAPKRLKEELAHFREAVRPDLADRIWLAAIDQGKGIQGEVPQDSPELRSFLHELAARELDSGVDRVSRETVKAHLINLWIDGAAPVSQAYLGRVTKSSAPTVASAMADLDKQGLLHSTPTGVTLYEPGWDDWRKLAETHAAKRVQLRFVDPSNLARPPIAMARRLRDLQQNSKALSVTISGVIGAMHYDDTLDITAPPRLDLCVHGGDVGFMHQLDAGLVLDDTGKGKAVAVIHMVPRTMEFETDVFGRRVATPLDCLADLLEMGLVSEARDFAFALNRRAKRRHQLESLNGR